MWQFKHILKHPLFRASPIYNDVSCTFSVVITVKSCRGCMLGLVQGVL